MKKIEIKKCLVCKKKFRAKENIQKYCSTRCRDKKDKKLYYQRHPEQKIKRNEYQKKIQKRNRRKILEYYGGKPPKCAQCGYDIYLCLDIDHMQNEGNIHRKHIKGSIYRWLIKNNYPKGFQVLCRNCNWLKYRLNKNKLIKNNIKT